MYVMVIEIDFSADFLAERIISHIYSVKILESD